DEDVRRAVEKLQRSDGFGGVHRVIGFCRGKVARDGRKYLLRECRGFAFQERFADRLRSLRLSGDVPYGSVDTGISRGSTEGMKRTDTQKDGVAGEGEV